MPRIAKLRDACRHGLGYAARGLSLAALVGRLPVLVAGAYIVLSTFTFVMYARDKSAARSDRWRTPEATLHSLGLLGGWPGALVAQKLLRHKSSKRPFLLVFWVTVTLNLTVLAWVLANPSVLRALE